MTSEFPQHPDKGQRLRRGVKELGYTTWQIIRNASKRPVLELWARAFLGVGMMELTPGIEDP